MGFSFFACATLRRYPSAMESTANLQKLCQFCGHGGESIRIANINARVRSLELQLGVGPAPVHDYALRGAGAFIITELTSSTARESRRTFPDGLDHSLTAMTPIVVIEDSLVSGDCWAFSGHTGHVAMFFSMPINITDMTVHYPYSLPPVARLQAPRNITLWGLEKPEDARKTFTHSESRQVSTFLTAQRLSHGYMDTSDHFSPLLTAEYQITPPYYGVQRFKRSRYGNALYRVVVIEVTSNWGADSTCLYHFGIHA